jgi:hypothetical protein
MNEISLFGSDLLLIVCAVVVSFALGSLHRLGRSLARQRRAVTLTEQEVRDLTQQCDRQQVSVTRLHQELSEMRQALMQQALAMAPLRAPAAASSAAPAEVPAAPAIAPAVASQRPPAITPAAPARRSDPLALARAGASVQVLMQRCALSRAEAELVISVHGGKRRAAA